MTRHGFLPLHNSLEPLKYTLPAVFPKIQIVQYNFDLSPKVSVFNFITLKQCL